MFGHIYKFKNSYRGQNFKLWTILENSTEMDSNHDSPIALYHFALVYFLNCTSNTRTYSHHKNKTNKILKWTKSLIDNSLTYTSSPIFTVARFFFTVISTVPSKNHQVRRFNGGFLRSSNLRQGEKEKKLFIFSHSLHLLLSLAYGYTYAMCM